MSAYDNKVSKGDLQFGLSLMPHLGEGNVVVSPTSIRLALSMLYEGASGETAKQVARAAYIPEVDSARWSGIMEITGALNTANAPYTLRCANGIWTSNRFPINPEYVRLLTDFYRAEARSVNFERNSEGERTGINEWVSGKTERKIPELFAPGSIHNLTVLVLANALYFKAPWENKFNPGYTKKQNFSLSGGQTVQVDMMRKGHVDSQGELPKFLYGELDGAQIAMLPYEGHQLAKMVMLPPRGTSVKDLGEYLRREEWDFTNLFGLLEKKKFARLEIPRHVVRCSYDLETPLKAVGIDRMFSATKDFQSISPASIWVDKVVHQTFFQTNEEGSEGAAATGAALRTLGMDMNRPVEFIADRPYLEAVVDQRTGSFLFLNRIEDPR